MQLQNVKVLIWTNGMRYLLDTNTIIYFLNKDHDVTKKIHLNHDICISVITVGELYFGANKSSRKKENTVIYDTYLETMDILYIDSNIAKQYAHLKSELRKIGNPIPDNDIWIAATAIEHNLIIATRDKHLLDQVIIKTEKW